MNNEFVISKFQRFLMKNAIVQFVRFVGNTFKILSIVRKI